MSVDKPKSAELHKIVMATAEKLRELGDHRVLILSHPHKYNDSWSDDYWCGVQVSGQFWEATHYYQYHSEEFPEPNDRSGGETAAHLEEKAIYYIDGEDLAAKDAPLQVCSPPVLKARSILRELEKTNWQELAKVVFAPMRIAHGIYLYAGEVWFVNGGYYGLDEGELWHCRHDGQFSLICRLGNLTENFGSGYTIAVMIDEKRLSGRLEDNDRVREILSSKEHWALEKLPRDDARVSGTLPRKRRLVTETLSESLRWISRMWTGKQNR